MKTQMKTLTLAILLGIGSMSVCADDPAPAPSTDQGGAPAAEQSADAAKDGESKNFKMSIGADGAKITHDDDESSGPGITISIKDDDDDKAKRADLAGKVVDRVVGDIERSLEGLPEDVRRDIDAKDMKELRDALYEIRDLKRERIVHHVDGGGVGAEVLPGVLAILLLFGGPVVIVAVVSYNRRRSRQMVHETIDRIIAQGKDVPVELLDKLDRGSNGKSMLSRGATNVAIGLGIAGCLWGLGGEEAASLGLIWICLGMGQLLIWRLEGNGKAAQSGTPVS